jgi:monolysocardiolipin acyltransferase
VIDVISSGRIVMEANIPPVIIPMWLTGFDKIMPEGRSFPYKYMPRLGTHISITFGDPLDTNDTREAFRLAHKIMKNKSQSQARETTGRITSNGSPVFGSGAELDNVRSNISEVIRHAVLVLGKKVSGPMLSND